MVGLELGNSRLPTSMPPGPMPGPAGTLMSCWTFQHGAVLPAPGNPGFDVAPPGFDGVPGAGVGTLVHSQIWCQYWLSNHCTILACALSVLAFGGMRIAFSTSWAVSPGSAGGSVLQ